MKIANEPKEIILNVLRQGEKVYPRYADIAKKIENDDYLDDADFRDIMTIVTAAIYSLTESLEHAEHALNEQEKLLQDYAGLVNRYAMMVTEPASSYLQ